MESGYVLAMERTYSLDELKDIARAKGKSAIGTKRDIATQLLKIELPVYPSTKQKYYSEEIFNRAKHYFGVTTNPEIAGYILPDGTMLNFSGKSFPQMGTMFPRWLYTKRELDHREISFAWPDSDAVGGHEGMRQFMNWGAVRFSLLSNTVIVNTTRRLTHSQISVIDYVLRNYPSYILVIEISDHQLSEMAFKEFLYPFTGWASYINNHIDSREQPGQTHVAQVKKTAFQYGKEAYMKGLKASSQDKEFMEVYIKGLQIGDPSSHVALKEWNRGWFTEHNLITDRELYNKQWQWGAEPAAAIPGEPIEFYKADKHLNNAEAVVVEVDTEKEDSKYYIMKKDGTYVRNPKTNTALFNTVDEAKDAHFKELKGGK